MVNTSYSATGGYKIICPLAIRLLGACCWALYASLALSHPGIDTQLSLINRSIQLEPDNQALLIQRGIAYSNHGQLDMAEQDFQRAESLGQPDRVAFGLGLLYFRRGEYAAARAYFNRYLNRFPNHPPSLEYRARAARDAGDFQSALADFDQLFQLQQNPNPDHFISAAEISLSVDSRDIITAIAILDRGIHQIGLVPQIQRYAIRLELQRQQPDKAVERMLSLKAALNDSAAWKIEMAELYLNNGQSQHAKKLLHQASLQLAAQRPTPARIEMNKKIDQLTSEQRHK